MWAVYKNNKLALMDSRLPIFWLKKIAKKWAEEKGLKSYELKKVEVLEEIKLAKV